MFAPTFGLWVRRLGLCDWIWNVWEIEWCENGVWTEKLEVWIWTTGLRPHGMASVLHRDHSTTIMFSTVSVAMSCSVCNHVLRSDLRNFITLTSKTFV